jgi:hypothetical protein
MFITGILVTIWIILFDRSCTFLFSVIFTSVFIMEIYIDSICISICLLSLPWFRMNNNQSIHWPFKLLWSYLVNNSSLSRDYLFEISNIQLQNQFRRLMFLKIQNLFQQQLINTNKNSESNKYSLLDYRCPICLNNKQDSFQWIALGCGHILCSICTQHLYFSNKSTCPNCRSSIILSDLTILYI